MSRWKLCANFVENTARQYNTYSSSKPTPTQTSKLSRGDKSVLLACNGLSSINPALTYILADPEYHEYHNVAYN